MLCRLHNLVHVKKTSELLVKTDPEIFSAVFQPSFLNMKTLDKQYTQPHIVAIEIKKSFGRPILHSVRTSPRNIGPQNFTKVLVYSYRKSKVIQMQENSLLYFKPRLFQLGQPMIINKTFHPE